MKVFIADINEICKESSLIEDYISRLKKEDLARYHKFSSQQRRIQFLIARMIIYENVGSDFTVADSGKLVTKTKYVSISHSKQYVIVAVANKAIGIDIEHINYSKDYKSLASVCGFKNIRNHMDFYMAFTKYEAIYKRGIQTKYINFFLLNEFLVCIAGEKENKHWIMTVPFSSRKDRVISLRELKI